MQAGGRRFDPDRLHTGVSTRASPYQGSVLQAGELAPEPATLESIAECSSSVWRKSWAMRPGLLVVPLPEPPVVAAGFFVRVNQVLVRLWTRGHTR